METENKCPVAEQVELTEYTITSDGTVVEANDIKENSTAFTDVIN